MEKFQCEVWEVRSSDGNGINDTHIAYFTTKIVADQLVKKSPSYMRARQATVNVVVFETLEEYQEDVLITRRKAILARLTDEEKKIIGVTE